MENKIKSTDRVWCARVKKYFFISLEHGKSGKNGIQQGARREKKWKNGKK